MREIGTIVDIKDGIAKIRIQRNSACGSCGACHVGKENMIMETSAPNILSAKIGDQVEIETETTNILKASFIIYTFPLILFIIGTFLGYLISSYTLFKDWSNTVGFIFGVLFMAFSYFIIKKKRRESF